MTNYDGNKLVNWQIVLITMERLLRDGRQEVMVSDLLVECWKYDNAKFGLKGFESRYPDSNKLAVLLSSGKSGLSKGYIYRIRPKYYSLTPLGLDKAKELNNE